LRETPVVKINDLYYEFNFIINKMEKICNTCRYNLLIDKFIKRNTRGSYSKDCSDCLDDINSKIIERQCNKCNNILPIDKFRFRNDRKIFDTKCKVCIAENMKTHRINNIDKYKQKDKLYHKINKELRNISCQKYYEKNKEKINMKRKEFRNNNPQNKILQSYRSRLYDLIKSGKNSPKFLGCTKNFLIKWFEFNFEIDSHLNLSLKNFGTMWQIDHVIPCEIYLKDTELDACFNWGNLYPLVNPYNQVKGSKILFHHILRQQLRLYLFLKDKNNHNYKSLILTTIKSCLPQHVGKPHVRNRCNDLWMVKTTRMG
jgi:hypothetical protein